MNRRSFIGRTIAAASALMAGKSVVEAVPIADSPAVQELHAVLDTCTYEDAGTFTDVITRLDNGTYRRERFLSYENGTRERISSVDYHSTAGRSISLPVGSDDDDEYSDE